jgi:hypothetical protein
MSSFSFGFFYSLPEDILRHELVEWLSFGDVGNLDSASCNKEHRSILLRLLSSNGTRLDCSSIVVDDLIISWIVMRNIQLQGTLRVSETVGDMGVTSVAQGCSNLQGLVLSRCSAVTDVGVTSIAQGCPNLQGLVLRWCSAVTDVGVTSIAQGCPSLQSLNLYDCRGL